MSNVNHAEARRTARVTPQISASPRLRVTHSPSEIDTELKDVTDRIVDMIGELS